MSERKNNDNSNEEQHATDAINKHLNQISSEIAHRVHPNVDFFEGHLHAVKESSELTIAKLEEVKMFLNKCGGGALKTTSSSSSSLASEKDIKMISERLERDFAFVDSAEATLKTIDERVTELEREIWESEKALLRDAVETKVGALRENFGRMFSGISSSFGGGGGGGSGEGGGGDATTGSTTTNGESSSSVDFEEAEKLRREVTKTKDTKDEKNMKQTLETRAKEKDDDNDNNNNNNNNNNNDGYYFGDDDEMGQVSPQKKETTGGLFGNFFNKSSSSTTTTKQ